MYLTFNVFYFYCSEPKQSTELSFSPFLLQPSSMEVKYTESLIQIWKYLLASFRDKIMCDTYLTFSVFYLYHSQTKQSTELSFSTFLLQPSSMEVKYTESLIQIWNYLLASFRGKIMWCVFDFQCFLLLSQSTKTKYQVVFFSIFPATE